MFGRSYLFVVLVYCGQWAEYQGIIYLPYVFLEKFVVWSMGSRAL
jgi:hypothetical protein